MKLYELTTEMKALEDLYNDNIDQETGEIMNAEVLEELERGLYLAIQNKGAGLIQYFRNNSSNINILTDEIERLTRLKKSLEKKEAQFKEFIIYNMGEMGIKKIETELGSLSIRESTSTYIYDESLIDERFIKTKIEQKPDKTAIKNAIKNGEEVQGAKLQKTHSLIIK